MVWQGMAVDLRVIRDYRSHCIYFTLAYFMGVNFSFFFLRIYLYTIFKQYILFHLHHFKDTTVVDSQIPNNLGPCEN